MENVKVKNGLILGAVMVALSLVLYLVSHRFYLTWGSWLAYAIAAFFMWKTAVAVREDEGGTLSFGGAFGAAWIPWAVGSLLSAIFAYVLLNFIDPSIMDTMKDIQMEAIDKMAGFIGEEGAEAAKEALEEQDSSFGPGTVLMGYLIGLLFPGALIALIVGAITKRSGGIA